MFSSLKNYNNILTVGVCVIIFATALFLRLYNASTFDIHHDNALYTFRALGWSDFVGGGQTTPVQWFGETPWWSILSFHDAPPLGFLIWAKSFVFGDSAFVSRIPTALYGALTAMCIFLFLRKRLGLLMATLTGILFSTLSYALWANYAGMLESYLFVFVTLSLFITILLRDRLNQTEGNKKEVADKTTGLLVVSLCVVLALSFLTKYTSLFLVPSVVIVLWGRSSKRILSTYKKYFVGGVALFVLILLPIIIFNIGTFATRGHFDAALSSMLGIKSEDFAVLAGRGVNGSFANLQEFVLVLFRMMTFPTALLFLGGFLYFGFLTFKKKANSLEFGLFIFTFWAIIQFTFSGPAERLVSVLSPLVVILIGTLFFRAYALAQEKKIPASVVLISLVFLAVIGYESYFSFKNNIVRNVDRPHDSMRYTRVYSLGFNELDIVLKDIYFKNNPPTLHPIRNVKDLEFLKPEAFSDRPVVLYDDRIEWFSYSWYIQRFQLYYHLPIIPISMVLQNGKTIDDFVSEAGGMGATNIYYLDAVGAQVRAETHPFDEPLSNISNLFQKSEMERQEIVSKVGERAFVIYTIK